MPVSRNSLEKLLYDFSIKTNGFVANNATLVSSIFHKNKFH